MNTAFPSTIKIVWLVRNYSEMYTEVFRSKQSGLPSIYFQNGSVKGSTVCVSTCCIPVLFCWYAYVLILRTGSCAGIHTHVPSSGLLDASATFLTCLYHIWRPLCLSFQWQLLVLFLAVCFALSTSSPTPFIRNLCETILYKTRFSFHLEGACEQAARLMAGVKAGKWETLTVTLCSGSSDFGVPGLSPTSPISVPAESLQCLQVWATWHSVHWEAQLPSHLPWAVFTPAWLLLPPFELPQCLVISFILIISCSNNLCPLGTLP